MIPDVPPVLFKYMSKDTARIVLENRTLRWSRASLLNDPYDMQVDLQLGINRERLKRDLLKRLWSAHYGPDAPIPQNMLGALISLGRGRKPFISLDEFSDTYSDALDDGIDRVVRLVPETNTEFRRQLSMAKVLCLSDVADNVLMWSHYGLDHQGVVLRFRDVPGLDSPWKCAKPVRYVERMPRFLDDAFFSDLMFEPVATVIKRCVDAFVYTKGAVWKYEREWRIYTGNGRRADEPFEDCPFHELELDAVIFGCRTPADVRKELGTLVRHRYPHASICEMRQEQDDYQLKVVPLRHACGSAAPGERGLP